MVKDNIKINYFNYLRKSTESEDRQVASIESQKKELNDLATREKLKVIDTLEESHSAKRPGRPLFNEMVKRFERGEANGLLIWSCSRASRNSIDTGAIIYLLDTGKLLEVRTPSQVFRNTPNDKFLLNLFCSQAKLENDNKGVDVRRGIKTKLEKGWRPGGAPQGYLNSKFKDRGDNDIARDPERFALIRKMWDLMLTGHYTVPRILEIANNEWGYTTRKTKRMGGKPLGKSSLYRIFTNIFYAGIIEHQGVQYQGKHEPMITPEEYDLVQLILGRDGKPRKTKRAFAFTGAIRCQECGCLYTAEIKKKIIKGTGNIKEYTYYHCTRRTTRVKCTQKKVIRDDDLELQIEKELDKYTIMPEFLHWALERIDERKETDVEDKINIENMQQKAIEQAESELKESAIMRRRQLIDDEEFLGDKKELEAKIAQLKSKLDNTESKTEKCIELEEKTFSFATYARSKFLNGGLELKREILMGLGEKPTIKSKILTIKPYEWFEKIEKGYPELESEYLGLEPTKMGDFENKKEALASICSRWQTSSVWNMDS